ncbi:hypothetical protein BDV97DRAFT_348046 [Delphinella strobiligena]|nr:hypothetical protein BDV97DRAFT_348046 [Delphinella strobiligena]
MCGSKILQLVLLPHRPVKDDAEIDRNLKEGLSILGSAPGLVDCWRGRKYEERFTQVYLLLWTDLEASHNFLASPSYERFHKSIQPAMNGRRVEWLRHARMSDSAHNNLENLRKVLGSPAIEVAWTMVVEGGVAGYYERFAKVVTSVLDQDPGCDGYFISPSIENPHAQMLLINWKSVDAHHVEFESSPGFKACIEALFDYYDVFVVPWHIVGLKRIWSDISVERVGTNALDGSQ